MALGLGFLYLGEVSMCNNCVSLCAATYYSSGLQDARLVQVLMRLLRLCQ